MAEDNSSAPRFEFRLFAPDLDRIVSRLERTMEETRRSTDTSLYLLWEGPDELNAKLRDGRLDIKDRVATRHGFEQWRPREPLAFPLDPGDIEGFPAIAGGQAFAADEFAKVCRAGGHVSAHVLKERRQTAHIARQILDDSGHGRRNRAQVPGRAA